jgi:hypothetical protein
MPKLRALIIAAVAVALLAPSISSARTLYFGISANSRERDTIAQDRAAETGVRRLREDLEWWRVEPSNGSWTWTETDAMYRTAAERGITILPILNSPACWAVPPDTPSDECREVFPTSNQDYADFASRAAARYGPSGIFWSHNPDLDASLASRYFEIWNEPYWGTGQEAVNPARYAALFTAAASAGERANRASRYLIESTVDGQGGVHWAEALKAAEPTIGTYIDGLAVHPYPGSHDVTYQPQYGTDEAFLNVKIDYERWRDLGVNKPVWITEVGYSSCADGVEHCVSGDTQADREARKATLLARLIDQVATAEFGFVHALYLYNLEQFSAATQPNADKSAWYGLLYGKTGEPLPAWSSFSSGVSKYSGAPVPGLTITSHALFGNSMILSFTSNDSTAGFECRVDNLAWVPCSSPASFGATGAGSHTAFVRAVNAQAISAVSAYSWTAFYLRPDGDRDGSGWSVPGATAAWDALNGDAPETDVPSSADRSGERQVELRASALKGPRLADARVADWLPR